MDRDASITWPLTPHYEHLLRELAMLIARGGEWRFLFAPVIAADVRNYPDKWEENRGGVAAVLSRTMWHAYLDLDATLEDVRQPAAPGRSRLRQTHVELTRVDDKRAEFTMSSVGNDDVAGIISHEVGRAYVAHLARSGHPFRTTDEGLPEIEIGSIATIYLGLGIVATNSAHFDRSAGETIGRTAYHEHKIESAGGLAVRDLAFLLAVQAAVRDDVLTGLDTLRPTQADLVAAWREVLDDHEDDLVTILGLTGDATSPPSRPNAPRPIVTSGAFDESNLHKQNYGQRVFRVPETRAGTAAILATLGGFAIGCVIAVVVHEPLLLLPLPILSFVPGYLYGRRKRYFRCASCGSFVTETAAECRMCGGKIAGEIKRARDRLDHEEALEAAERAATATTESN